MVELSVAVICLKAQKTRMKAELQLTLEDVLLYGYALALQLDDRLVQIPPGPETRKARPVPRKACLVVKSMHETVAGP